MNLSPDQLAMLDRIMAGFSGQMQAPAPGAVYAGNEFAPVPGGLDQFTAQDPRLRPMHPEMSAVGRPEPQPGPSFRDRVRADGMAIDMAQMRPMSERGGGIDLLALLGGGAQAAPQPVAAIEPPQPYGGPDMPPMARGAMPPLPAASPYVGYDPAQQAGPAPGGAPFSPLPSPAMNIPAIPPEQASGEMFGKIPMPAEFAGQNIGLGADGFYSGGAPQTAIATNDAPMQPPQAAPGGGMFGDEFKARLGDMFAGWAMGAGGTWQDSLAGGGKMIAAGKLSRGEKKELAKSANKTAEWAIGQGVDPGTVEAYLSAGDAKGLIGLVESYKQGGVKPTADIQEYEFAKSQGYGGSYMDFQKELKAAGSTKIENNIGDNGVKYPDPPSGYDYMRGPDGRPVIEGGLPKLAPIPGGDAYQKTQAAGAKEAAGQEKTAATGNLVVEDIDRALNLIETATLPTTGMGGSVLSTVGGTAANDVRALMDTVRANTGFAELSAMRAASPTGGALGSVTERELALLTATMGNLEQSQTKEQFTHNLKRLRELYLDTIHGPGNRPGAGAADGWTTLPNGVRVREVK